jgi:hypothetical protein
MLYLLLLVVNDYRMKSATLNDYLSFVICLLQLRAFKHILFSMTTKSIIYGVINLTISSSAWVDIIWFVLNSNDVMHKTKSNDQTHIKIFF